MHHFCTLAGFDSKLSWQLHQELLHVYGHHCLSYVHTARCTAQYLRSLQVKVLLLHEYDIDFLNKLLPVIEEQKIHCFIIGQRYAPSKYIHTIPSISQLPVYHTLLPCLAQSCQDYPEIHQWCLPALLYLQVGESATRIHFADCTITLPHNDCNFRVMVSHPIQIGQYLIRKDCIRALQAGNLHLQTGKTLPLKEQVFVPFQSICHSLLPHLYVSSVDQSQI